VRLNGWPIRKFKDLRILWDKNKGHFSRVSLRILEPVDFEARIR
jgi:hypothetical protein